MPLDIAFDLPWPLRTSRHIDQARIHSLAWMEEFGLFDGAASTPAEFIDWRLAELAAYFYPDATREGLELASDLMGWYFAPFDDQFDGELGRNPRQVARICADLVTFTGSSGGRSWPVAAALADIWRRSCHGMSQAWRSRALVNWRGYLAAHTAESINRHHAHVLDPEQCVQQRSYSTSTHVVIDLIERVNGFAVPDMAWYNPILRELRTLTAEILGLSNDLCSAEREEARGETDNNFILILERHHGYRRAEAIDQLRRLTDQRLTRFLAAERRVPDLDCILSPAEQTTTRRFTQGLHDLIAGDHEWERTSGRNAVPAST